MWCILNGMSRRFLLLSVCLLVFVTSALGGIAAVVLWQLQSNSGGLAALLRAQIVGGGDDPDRDGLTNEEEAIWGTDPNNPDTDGDGYNDRNEVYTNHNPLVAGPDTNKLPAGFVPGKISNKRASTYLAAVDDFMVAVKDLGAWSNRDMLNVALEDWLARKDEDTKKKNEDEKIRLLKAILVAVGGQVPVEPTQDPVKCSKEHKEKCTALLLRGLQTNLDTARKRVLAAPAPTEAARLNTLVLSYSEEALSILDKIIAAEQEDDKEKAVAAIHALQILDREGYDLLVGEVEWVRSIFAQQTGPK